jgi:hypothetical protein
MVSKHDIPQRVKNWDEEERQQAAHLFVIWAVDNDDDEGADAQSTPVHVPWYAPTSRHAITNNLASGCQ